MANEKRVDDKGRKLPDGFSQRPDGRYMARFTYQGKRYTLYDMNLNALKQKVWKKQMELETHTYAPQTRLTVDQWHDVWCENYYKNSVKPSTYTTMLCSYNRHIRRTRIGKMKLTEVRNANIVELYQELREKYKPATIQNVHANLRLMYNRAILNGMVDRNPTDGAISTVRKEKKVEQRVFSKEEEKDFFEFITNDLYFFRYVPFYTVGFNTGLRVGEIHGLAWDDLDFDNNIIHVRRTIYYQKNVGDEKARFHISTPKTYNSEREIPMLPEVKKAFEWEREFQKMQKHSRKYKEVSVDGVQGFVFTTESGTPRREETAWKTGRLIIKRMNEREQVMAIEEGREPKIYDDFHPHTMRHTFTSRAVEAGVDPATLSKILGHASVRTTYDIYTHISIEQKEKEMYKLSGGE